MSRSLFILSTCTLWLVGCSGLPNAPDGGAAGLPAPLCTDTNPAVCRTTDVCARDSDCGSRARTCRQQLGTFTTEFVAIGCIDGSCHYRTRAGGCSDQTPCQSCAAQPGCGDQPTAGACLDCAAPVASRAAPLTTCVCSGCAACAGSQLCGGDAGHSDACASCAVGRMIDPACASLFAEAGCTDDCRDARLRVLACRR